MTYNVTLFFKDSSQSFTVDQKNINQFMQQIQKGLFYDREENAGVLVNTQTFLYATFHANQEAPAEVKEEAKEEVEEEATT